MSTCLGRYEIELHQQSRFPDTMLPAFQDHRNYLTPNMIRTETMPHGQPKTTCPNTNIISGDGFSIDPCLLSKEAGNILNTATTRDEEKLFPQTISRDDHYSVYTSTFWGTRSLEQSDQSNYNDHVHKTPTAHVDHDASPNTVESASHPDHFLEDKNITVCDLSRLYIAWRSHV